MRSVPASLSARCGAGIYHGPAAAFEYGNPARESDRYGIGDFVIDILGTPGHTPESLSFVLRENGSKMPVMVFTGDALFAGDVGRTDLLGPDRAAGAAGALWDSLHGKILPLGDGVIVCPAHGAGSVCGGEISDREYTTIGYERENNPLCTMARPEFIAFKTAEHHYIPPYFATMERLNLSGPPPARMLPAPPAFSPPEVASFAARGAQLLDIRSPTAFGAGHIPGSLSIWRDGLPAWMGWFLDYDRPVILVDDFNVGLDRVARHFTRLGYDNLAGFLAGGFPAWFREARPVGRIRSLSVQQDCMQSGRPESCSSSTSGTSGTASGPGRSRDLSISMPGNSPRGPGRCRRIGTSSYTAMPGSRARSQRASSP